MSEQSDAEFFSTFIWVLVALTVIGGAAMYIAISVIDASGLESNNPLYAEDVVNDRIAPVGKIRMQGDAEVAVAGKDDKPKAKNAGPRAGSEIVASTCSGCHQVGVMGAPKIGDKAGWEPRMAGGLDALVASAIKGKGGMPPKGGCTDCSDDEIRNGLIAMLKGSGIDAGPEVKAAATEAAPAAPAAAAKPAAASVAPAAAPAPTTAAPKTASANGEKAYNTSCIGCHGGGMPMAPKVHNAAAWGPRLKTKGQEGLYASALNGLPPMMPPRGACMGCSDADIKAAVDYMLEGVK